MAQPIARPWAILLCRFQDDANDPSATSLGQLYQQWLAKFGATWLANNLDPAVAADPRTILELYSEFFVDPGVTTWNSVRYWSDMSHGSIDVSASKVFPCKLDIDSATGAAMAAAPGGAAYQNAIFQKAKAALKAQYGVDWKDFFAVAVSFQSPDYGNQGGAFDGGVGVFSDIRFVRNQGMASWGQEMGHAFGLDHSRQDGSASDYLDPWDVMSTMAALCYTPDANFGLRGIGLNAWNMRGRAWLDESRIWKGSQQGFAELVTLRPLHRRDLDGWLGAELPAIGADCSYLVEFRVPSSWDSNIPAPAILVHRFEGPIGQFLGTHSYLEKGTLGQVALSVGDGFELGKGPWVSAAVKSIDVASNTATIFVVYSSALKAEPSVKIRIVETDSCWVAPEEGAEVKLAADLLNAPAGQSHKILWNVVGAPLSPGTGTSSSYLTIIAPDPSVSVNVAVTVVFDDGTTIVASYKFNSVSIAEGSWLRFLCKLSEDRPKPIPWWEWDPEKLQKVADRYSPAELKLVGERAQRIAETLTRLTDFGDSEGAR